MQDFQRKHKTDVYVMRIVEELEAWDDLSKRGRQRRWFTRQEAVTVLKKTQLSYIAALDQPHLPHAPLTVAFLDCSCIQSVRSRFISLSNLLSQVRTTQPYDFVCALHSRTDTATPPTSTANHSIKSPT